MNRGALTRVQDNRYFRAISYYGGFLNSWIIADPVNFGILRIQVRFVALSGAYLYYGRMWPIFPTLATSIVGQVIIWYIEIMLTVSFEFVMTTKSGNYSLNVL